MTAKHHKEAKNKEGKKKDTVTQAVDTKEASSKEASSKKLRAKVAPVKDAQPVEIKAQKRPTIELESKGKKAKAGKTKDEISGKVSKFLYKPGGDTDGFLLDGLYQIHYPPHLSAKVIKGVNLGDKVSAQGLKDGKTGLFVAASIINARSNLVVAHVSGHKGKS